MQAKRGRRSERWEASQLHVLQPVWPKGLSAWRFGGFNDLQSERTSRLSREQMTWPTDSHHCPSLCFRGAEDRGGNCGAIGGGAVPAPPDSRTFASQPCPYEEVCDWRVSAVQAQTALDGRPPALIEANTKAARGHLTARGESPRRGSPEEPLLRRDPFRRRIDQHPFANHLPLRALLGTCFARPKQATPGGRGRLKPPFQGVKGPPYRPFPSP